LNRIQSNAFTEFDFQTVSEERSSMPDTEFKNKVGLAKQHCKAGDVFQLVLSKRYSQDFKGDEFNVYRALKNINPSPYLFYFDMGDFKLFGSSPEAQLVIKNGEAEIHPIAGTYRRTQNDAEDLEKAMELKRDPKENAEHMMLVDLARNDLSKYCSGVKVDSLKQVQLYSHVIHLVSKVKGVIREKTHPFEILFGSFPAGTLSGAPKYRAMQLIDTYEPEAREFYGGCVGIIDHKNNLNHAIMIRTFLSKDNTLHYQAGAGIVISSNEESELNEVKNKLSALKKAIDQAAKFNRSAPVNQTEESFQPQLIKN
jgi:anthranilate synthase component I